MTTRVASPAKRQILHHRIDRPSPRQPAFHQAERPYGPCTLHHGRRRDEHRLDPCGDERLPPPSQRHVGKKGPNVGRNTLQRQSRFHPTLEPDQAPRGIMDPEPQDRGASRMGEDAQPVEAHGERRLASRYITQPSDESRYPIERHLSQKRQRDVGIPRANPTDLPDHPGESRPYGLDPRSKSVGHPNGDETSHPSRASYPWRPFTCSGSPSRGRGSRDGGGAPTRNRRMVSRPYWEKASFVSDRGP